MKSTLKVSLKANERIYVNGAVIRVDRKTTMEFLNDVSFLLENHVMQAVDADTPVRQLYYLVQLLLMDPTSKVAVMALYRAQMLLILEGTASVALAAELKGIDRLVHESSLFEAMKSIRRIFGNEFEGAADRQGDASGIRSFHAPYLRASPSEAILATGEG